MSNLKYKDCLELKEAGFPEGSDETGSYIEGVYVPTLKELIDECGDHFLGLSRIKKDEWVAFSKDKNFKCSSPEEAVKNLYLDSKGK